MAIARVDDINGEPGAVEVHFSLDDIDYAIDLAPRNHEELRAALAPYIEKAREMKEQPKDQKAAPQKAPRNSRRSTSRNVQEIRDWARANGYTVNDRGRISAEVMAAYNAEHTAA